MYIPRLLFLAVPVSYKRVVVNRVGFVGEVFRWKGIYYVRNRGYLKLNASAPRGTAMNVMIALHQHPALIRLP